MAEGFRGPVGGIHGLIDLIREHGESIEIDLIQVGLRLRDVGTDQFTWRDLKLFLRGLSVHSATFTATHPEEAGWDNKAMLLADAVDQLRWLVWAKTKDGQKNRNHPQPIQRPGVEPTVKKVSGTPVTIDKFGDQLKKLRKKLATSESIVEQSTRISVRREKVRNGNRSG